MTPEFQRKYLDWCRRQREGISAIPLGPDKSAAGNTSQWDRIIRKMERELG